MRHHPIFGINKLHAGIDLVSQPGPGPVVAAAAGTVIFSGYRDGGGNTVDIEHDGAVLTRYLHLAQPSTLRPGDPVQYRSTGRRRGVHR